MTFSNTENENYFGYFIVEILLVSAVTFLTTVILIFYSVGQNDIRRNRNQLGYLMDNLLVYGSICLFPTLIAVLLLLYRRNRNYIIGYQFEHSSKTLTIEYRNLYNKVSKDTVIPYEKLLVEDIKEKGFLFNQAYTGKSIMRRGNNVKLDFVTNNFIWEKQPKEKGYFLDELNRIQKI